MPTYGKPDQKGRSSGKLTGRARKLRSPPKGEPWRWLTRELLESAAWRGLSINGRKLIDFLLIEDMAHAGTENGNLVAPYDQLEAYALTRSEIRFAIDEAEFVGLIRCSRGGRWAGTNRPSRYRLTFYCDRDGNDPTNEWKGKTVEAVNEWQRDQAARRKAAARRRQIQKASSSSRTTVVRLPALRNGRR